VAAVVLIIIYIVVELGNYQVGFIALEFAAEVRGVSDN
jgi:hypothetical protein